VYRVVCRIPAGQVATYGQIAALSGMPRAARQVGWALSALGEQDDVPWHRVINAQGEISPRGGPEVVDLQRALLEFEGIEFNRRDRVDLDRYCWVPGRRKAKSGTSRKPGSRTSDKAVREIPKNEAKKVVTRAASKRTPRQKPQTKKGSAR
jgi:methylated-DNA-protein-cysteine methyltransferase-like protein